jgi:hypothetical protein
MAGSIHLYKHYQGESSESEDPKPNLAANQIEIKTQVLFVNHLLLSKLPELLILLGERRDEIELMDRVWEESHQHHISLVVYAKSVLASEEIFQLVLLNFHLLPFYVKEVTLSSGLSSNRERLLIINSDMGPLEEGFVYHQRWIEIPRCIECLEKLEYDLTGISAQLFQEGRANHVACMTCQTISKSAQLEGTVCSLCCSPEDNWICMVCSSIGCGRYKKADAFNHFLSDGHIITMDLETQRVWNYLSDCFSHRVIPLEKQQATLKFPDCSAQKNDGRYEESLESAFWEYCSVVSEELERQRLFYEKQKLEEEERFKKETCKLDQLAQDLQAELEEKALSLKRLGKRAKKGEKRLEEVREKCKLDREILANYEKTVREAGKEESLEEIEEKSCKIQEKLKIMRSIDS